MTTHKDFENSLCEGAKGYSCKNSVLGEKLNEAGSTMGVGIPATFSKPQQMPDMQAREERRLRNIIRGTLAAVIDSLKKLDYKQLSDLYNMTHGYDGIDLQKFDRRISGPNPNFMKNNGA